VRLGGCGEHGRGHHPVRVEKRSRPGRTQDPVLQAHLYLVPADAASEASLSQGLHRAEVEKGRSTITGPLAPGKYLAIVTDLDTDGTVETLTKLWRARSKAKEVEIGPNAMVHVTLELVEVK